MVIATGSIKEPATTQDRTIGQIQPKVAGQITLCTLPSGWRNGYAVVQLNQILGKLRVESGLAIPGSGKRFLVQFNVGRLGSQDGLNGLDHLEKKTFKTIFLKNPVFGYLLRQSIVRVWNRGVFREHDNTQMVLVLELGLANVWIETALHTDGQTFDFLLWNIGCCSGGANDFAFFAIDVQVDGVLCVLIVPVDVVLAERQERG